MANGVVVVAVVVVAAVGSGRGWGAVWVGLGWGFWGSAPAATMTPTGEVKNPTPRLHPPGDACCSTTRPFLLKSGAFSLPSVFRIPLRVLCAEEDI